MSVIVPEWRSPEERFGIYRIRGDELQLVATVQTQEAIGVAIFVLGMEGEWENCDGFGVLDSFGDPSKPGKWLVNPFRPGRSA